MTANSTSDKGKRGQSRGAKPRVLDLPPQTFCEGLKTAELPNRWLAVCCFGVVSRVHVPAHTSSIGRFLMAVHSPLVGKQTSAAGGARGWQILCLIREHR